MAVVLLPGAHAEDTRSLGALSVSVLECGSVAGQEEERHAQGVKHVQAALNRFFDQDLLVRTRRPVFEYILQFVSKGPASCSRYIVGTRDFIRFKVRNKDLDLDFRMLVWHVSCHATSLTKSKMVIGSDPHCTLSQDDVPTARTPKWRHIEVSPPSAIELLRAPDFSSLCEDFKGKHSQLSQPSFSQEGVAKLESRIPCAAVTKSQEGLDRSESRIPFAALSSN
jgi:hypothetical protein